MIVLLGIPLVYEGRDDKVFRIHGLPVEFSADEDEAGFFEVRNLAFVGDGQTGRIF